MERHEHKAAWWLLLVTACTHFCLAYVQNSQPFLNLDEYIGGRSRLPYQYRVLMAWILRGGLRVPHLLGISAGLPAPLHDPRLFIIFITSWISLFGSVVLTWRSLHRLTTNEQYSRWLSLLVIYMAYFQFPLVFGLNFLLPYDLPSLFLFCACLYCVISRRMALFYLFFVVGTLNRETICMVTLFFVIWRWNDIVRRQGFLILVGHTLVQVALWVSIKACLHRWFGGNALDTRDASLYYKLAYNLEALAKPQQWPVLLSVFGFTLPVVLVWRKSMKNIFMERSLYVLVVWFGVMMLVGVITEVRIFSELISYMSLAVALIVYHKLPTLCSSLPESFK